jgi:hypothetical protein
MAQMGRYSTTPENTSLLRTANGCQWQSRIAADRKARLSVRAQLSADVSKPRAARDGAGDSPSSGMTRSRGVPVACA